MSSESTATVRMQNFGASKVVDPLVDDGLCNVLHVGGSDGSSHQPPGEPVVHGEEVPHHSSFMLCTCERSYGVHIYSLTKVGVLFMMHFMRWLSSTFPFCDARYAVCYLCMYIRVHVWKITPVLELLVSVDNPVVSCIQ